MQRVVGFRGSGVRKARSAPRAFWRLIASLALLLGLFGLASAANGAGGELDRSFDGDGRVVTDFGAFDGASGVAIQADGKVVAAGLSGDGFALARYNPDGSLDPSFGGDGRVVTEFGAGEFALAVAIQADGKIVAVGSTSAGANARNFALARYTADGSLDPTFGGDGRVVTDFGAFDQAHGVGIQVDGKIIAAGESHAGANSDFALVRYKLDGSLDPTFDGDGRVATDFGDSDAASGVAIQTDGRIVAAGGSGAGTVPFNFAFARYNPDGRLDPSFDGDGRVLTGFGEYDFAHGVAIQADGKIVAAGETFAGANPLNFALARLNSDGSLDPSFDGDGRAVTDFGAFDWASAVAIQADGKVVAAGQSNVGAHPNDFALARYRPGGSLDTSFDGDGRVVTDINDHNFARGVAMQPDGRIIAVGTTGTDPDYDFALARYLPDGAPVNQPPDCSRVAASPNRLRPPNHQLRLVTLGGVTDPDGDIVRLTVTAVTQDEPLNGLGDGDRSPDARSGTRSDSVFLRAERSGRGDGRVYRVSSTGSDGKGGSCSGTVTVGVPRNAGSTPIDSAPPNFDSFGP